MRMVRIANVSRDSKYRNAGPIGLEWEVFDESGNHKQRFNMDVNESTDLYLSDGKEVKIGYPWNKEDLI